MVLFPFITKVSYSPVRLRKLIPLSKKYVSASHPFPLERVLKILPFDKQQNAWNTPMGLKGFPSFSSVMGRLFCDSSFHHYQFRWVRAPKVFSDKIFPIREICILYQFLSNLSFLLQMKKHTFFKQVAIQGIFNACLIAKGAYIKSNCLWCKTWGTYIKPQLVGDSAMTTLSGTLNTARPYVLFEVRNARTWNRIRLGPGGPIPPRSFLRDPLL